MWASLMSAVLGALLKVALVLGIRHSGRVDERKDQLEARHEREMEVKRARERMRRDAQRRADLLRKYGRNEE